MRIICGVFLPIQTSQSKNISIPKLSKTSSKYFNLGINTGGTFFTSFFLIEIDVPGVNRSGGT